MLPGGRSLKERMHSPPSSETSSMSDVTDILCAVSSGDLEGAASSLGASVFASTSLGRAGTSGTGESARPSCAVDAEEPGRLRRERDDRGRSAWESGRGVISDASSKLSCRNASQQCSCAYGRPGECSLLIFQSPTSSWAGCAFLLLWRVRPWSTLRAAICSSPGNGRRCCAERVQALRWVGIAGVRARRQVVRRSSWALGTWEREVNGNM
jgi:hypothetical protein